MTYRGQRNGDVWATLVVALFPVHDENPEKVLP
jgi:hypothetical protein